MIEIGKLVIFYKEINDELNKVIKSENLQGIYHCIGMWGNTLETDIQQNNIICSKKKK